MFLYEICIMIVHKTESMSIMKSNLKKRIVSVFLACVCLMPAGGLQTAAVGIGEGDRYTVIPVLADGVRITYGLKAHNTTYVPIREFCKAVDPGARVHWNEETESATIKLDGLVIKLCIKNKYLTANGRYIYFESGIINIAGTTYVPIRELCRAFGLDPVWNAENKTISINTEKMQFIAPGDGYYDESDLYWLSRLIYSEAGNQPIDGKIGVGNVVLNRVADPSCPDTIYDVIFDSRYGVQFYVAETGAVYEEPNEESEAAAGICLEGYNTVGDSIYFFNPGISASNWITANRTYIAGIGDHLFYY